MTRLAAFLGLALFALASPPAFANEFRNKASTCSDAVRVPGHAVPACDWLLELTSLSEKGRATVHYLRGVAHFMMARYEQSTRDFGASIRSHPRNAPAYVARGSAYFQLQRYDQAIRDFDLAIRIQPNLSEAYNSRANTQLKIGRHERALDDFEKAIRFRAKFVRAYIDRSMAHAAMGRHDAAEEDLDKAMRMADGNAEAYSGLARHFATAGDPRFRDGARAVEFAERATKLELSAAIIDTLAAAYAEAGRFQDAVREQKRAIEAFKAEGAGETTMADFQLRLELYRSGESYRE